jgi:hypothetical protein
MRQKDDMFFQNLVSAKGDAWLKISWTTKEKAMVLTKSQAEKTMAQIKEIAKHGGVDAPLWMEAADQN